jgi:hypothetical protein
LRSNLNGHGRPCRSDRTSKQGRPSSHSPETTAESYKLRVAQLAPLISISPWFGGGHDSNTASKAGAARGSCFQVIDPISKIHSMESGHVDVQAFQGGIPRREEPAFSIGHVGAEFRIGGGAAARSSRRRAAGEEGQAQEEVSRCGSKGRMCRFVVGRRSLLRPGRRQRRPSRRPSRSRSRGPSTVRAF